MGLLSLSACQQPPVAKSNLPAAPPVLKDGVQFIVELGESSQATYSPDGEKVLFVSRKRDTHGFDQVYEKDLNSGFERRITFQNGNTSGPRYHPKENLIVYASSTDELKEKPPVGDAALKPSKLPDFYQQPTEIYIHSLRGLDIERATQHPGFDGEAQFSNDGTNVTFTRVLQDRTQILSYNRATHQVREVKGLGPNPAQYIATADGKWHAWLSYDAAFALPHLMLQHEKMKALEINSDSLVGKQGLSFSPDSKYLLWSQGDAAKTSADLWSLNLDTNCPQRLTTNVIDYRRDPSVSPDGRWLLFTLQQTGGRSRIARQLFAPPQTPCPPPS